MLRPRPIGPIPSETARVARAAFPKGNRYLRVADELETLFTDDAFLALFPPCGRPAQPPWQLALATILHFAEGLSDSPKGSPIAKRRMPCAAASTGNMCCVWSSQTPGSTPRSSVNFVAD
jgi:transposase